jgi:hypothetical protein
VGPPSEFDVLEEKANEQLAKLKEATFGTLHKVRGGFEGAREAGEDAAEAALANAAESIEGMIEKMITEFCESGQDAVLEIKAKLLAMAKEKANKTFKEAYEKAQKYRCCSALQRTWWMFRELDPLVLTKHINEMEQTLSLVNGLFELEVKDTNLDEVSCALQHATRTQYTDGLPFAFSLVPGVQQVVVGVRAHGQAALQASAPPVEQAPVERPEATQCAGFGEEVWPMCFAVPKRSGPDLQAERRGQTDQELCHYHQGAQQDDFHGQAHPGAEAADAGGAALTLHRSGRRRCQLHQPLRVGGSGAGAGLRGGRQQHR